MNKSRKLRTALPAVVVLLLMLLSMPAARADTWLPAEVQSMLSADGTTRLTIIPRGIESPLAYFDDKVEGREPAGQKKGASTVAIGFLERLQPDGRWLLVWKRNLLNEVSPVSALVSDSGAYVATFDNWHSAGYGPDVVVVYGPDGAVIRSFSLSDLLPDSYIKELPRSVSSRSWGHDHYFSGDTLVLRVSIPGRLRGTSSVYSGGKFVPVPVPPEDVGKPTYVELKIELPGGRVSPVSVDAWGEALARARQSSEESAVGRRAFNAKLKAPYPAPADGPDGNWDEYLREVFWRLDPDAPAQCMGTKEIKWGWSDLPPPSYRNFESSLNLLRSHLRSDTRIVVIGTSGAAADLADTVEDIMRKARAGSLSKKRIYVAIPTAFHGRIEAAFHRSGAQLILVDPAKPLPPLTYPQAPPGVHYCDAAGLQE